MRRPRINKDLLIASGILTVFCLHTPAGAVIHPRTAYAVLDKIVHYSPHVPGVVNDAPHAPYDLQLEAR